MTEKFQQEAHNRLNRKPVRGSYDVDVVHAILDEAIVCHVSFIDQGRPFVIPTNFGRVGNTIYLHGAKTSRMLAKVASGEPICIEVTHLDGLVLARSLFNHSVNYRSVLCFGTGRVVESDEEKMEALLAVSEQMLKGRWDEARTPNAKELGATLVVAFTIEEASAKTRTGGVMDEAEDMDLGYWAGVVPMKFAAGKPETDGNIGSTIPLPPSVRNLSN